MGRLGGRSPTAAKSQDDAGRQSGKWAREPSREETGHVRERDCGRSVSRPGDGEARDHADGLARLRLDGLQMHALLLGHHVSLSALCSGKSGGRAPPAPCGPSRMPGWPDSISMSPRPSSNGERRCRSADQALPCSRRSRNGRCMAAISRSRCTRRTRRGCSSPANARTRSRSRWTSDFWTTARSHGGARPAVRRCASTGSSLPGYISACAPSSGPPRDSSWRASTLARPSSTPSRCAASASPTRSPA